MFAMHCLQRYVLLCLLYILPGFAVHAEQSSHVSAEQRLIVDVLQAHYVPRAAAFAVSAGRLSSMLNSMCSIPAAERLESAQRAWTGAMLAWESLGAVAIGPMLERGTEANIDFWPARATS